MTLHIRPAVKSALEATALQAGVSVSTMAAQLLTETVLARFPQIDTPQAYRSD